MEQWKRRAPPVLGKGHGTGGEREEVSALGPEAKRRDERAHTRVTQGNRKSSPASPRVELSRGSPHTARGPSHSSRNGGCHAQVHRTGGASEGKGEEGTWGDPRAQAPCSAFLRWAPRSGCHQHLQANGSPRHSPRGGSIWGGVHGAGVKPTGCGAGHLLSRDPAPSAYPPSDATSSPPLLPCWQAERAIPQLPSSLTSPPLFTEKCRSDLPVRTAGSPTASLLPTPGSTHSTFPIQRLIGQFCLGWISRG